MELLVDWSKTITLKKHQLFYTVDVYKIPTAAGIYVFGRKYSNNFEALYIGKANDLQGRISSQFNNLQLMQHIKFAKSGKRVLMIGTLHTKPGQKIDKCLKLVERALIRHFLSEGHDLVNKQGTRIKRHEIVAEGRVPIKVVPKVIFLEKAKKD
jgi:hypothetical protein